MYNTHIIEGIVLIILGFLIILKVILYPSKVPHDIFLTNQKGILGGIGLIIIGILLLTGHFK